MTSLPTFSGARVVAHTTANTTRRVFERDGSDFLPWVDVDRQDAPSPLWRDPSELLDPVPVPHNPKTSEYLYYVPSDATIPAGATYYRSTPAGLFNGPFEKDKPYTPAMRSAPHIHWTEEPVPGPEPETETVAGPGWWDVLTDDQRDRLEGLSGEQAARVADLVQHDPGESTVVGRRGILPALRELASNNTGDRQYGLVLALDAFLGGDL